MHHLKHNSLLAPNEQANPILRVRKYKQVRLVPNMMDGARWDFVNENDNDESLLNTPVQLRHQVGNGDNEPSFNSYQETSFDSEGFGQKVAGK